MSKKNIVMIVGLVVIVGASIIFAVVSKPDKNSSSTANKTPATSSHISTKASTTNSQKASSSGSSSSTQSASSDIINTKTDATAGSFLTDPNGKPLYTNSDDKTGASGCYGSCLVNWPIYGPASSKSTLPANVTVFKRSYDSKLQYAYKGMALYFYKSDSKGVPGGNGINDFHLAKP